MTAISDPNMGLFFGFDLGETPWNVEMDSNMQILGGMAMLAVISRSITAPPGSPVNGDIYYVPLGASGVWASHLQNIAIFSDLQFTIDAQGWLYVPVMEGWQFRVRDEVGQDGQMLSVFYTAAALTESIDLTNFVQKDENYTATGVIDFTNTITRSSIEIATVDDITTAISAQDFSDFVHITGTETITGDKTFSATVAGIDAVGLTDFTTLQQVQAEVDQVAGSNVGAFVDVFKNKTGDTLNFRTVQSSDTSVTIVQNTDDIDFTVTFPPSVTTFLALTDVDPATYAGQSGKVVTVNGIEDGLEFNDPVGAVQVFDEGGLIGTVSKINFIGADVNSFLNGDTVDIYIPSVSLVGSGGAAPAQAILGDTITDVTLTWAYTPVSAVLSSQTLTGSSLGNIPVLTTDRVAVLSSLSLTDTEIFTVDAVSPFGSDQFTMELEFVNHIYYGKFPSNDISTETDIKNLSDVVNAADFTSPTYSFIAISPAEWLYICWPTRLGLSTIWDNLDSPFDIVIDSNVPIVSVTNAEGFTEDYYATHSQNALAGAFNIKVI